MERIEVILEASESLGFFYERMLNRLAQMSHGRLAKWSFVPKGTTCLTEPSDYLCFHLWQSFIDASSTKSIWTQPIIEKNAVTKDRLTRREVTELFGYLETDNYTRHAPGEVKAYRGAIKTGREPDPWEKL